MLKSTAKMLELREAGVTFQEIGRRFHITRQGVIGRFRREGIPYLSPACSFCGKRTLSATQTLCRACRTYAARDQRKVDRISHFWERVDHSGGPDACWPWVGYTHPNGYGRLTWQGRGEYAHRVAWSLTTGEPIPRGIYVGCKFILHSCEPQPDHVRACCNPRHLYKGSPKQNVADRDQNGHHVGARGYRKLICKRGHVRTPDKLYLCVIKKGPQAGSTQRSCKICQVEQRKAKYWADPGRARAAARAKYRRTKATSPAARPS